MSKLAGALGLTVLQGCYLGAVDPWFPKEDRVEPPTQALGNWVESGEKAPAPENPMRLSVTAGAERTLWVQIADGDGVADFSVALTRVANSIYVDAQLDPASTHFKTFSSYTLRPHFLVKAKLQEDTLSLHVVEKNWLVEQIKHGKVKLPAYPPLDNHDNLSVLTLPTVDLKRLMSRLDREKDVKVNVVTFRRAP